jgi:hypothetical protein
MEAINKIPIKSFHEYQLAISKMRAVATALEVNSCESGLGDLGSAEYVMLGLYQIAHSAVEDLEALGTAMVPQTTYCDETIRKEKSGDVVAVV